MPNKEARLILLVVPCCERVLPLILRLATRWRRLRSAALLSDGARRVGHKDEEFLDEAMDAPAERVQPSFQRIDALLQLRNSPLLLGDGCLLLGDDR